METLQIKTPSHCCAIDVTDRVGGALKEKSAQNGLCLIYVPHTTAAVIVNEGADRDVMEDVLEALDRLVPWKGGYKHVEANSAAHIKAILAGAGAQLVVDSGHLVLGTWQRIFLLEFDGPRTRKIFVQFVGDRGPSGP